jgi:hypothetical protein
MKRGVGFSIFVAAMVVLLLGRLMCAVADLLILGDPIFVAVLEGGGLDTKGTCGHRISYEEDNSFFFVR